MCWSEGQKAKAIINTHPSACNTHNVHILLARFYGFVVLAGWLPAEQRDSIAYGPTYSLHFPSVCIAIIPSRSPCALLAQRWTHIRYIHCIWKLGGITRNLKMSRRRRILQVQYVISGQHEDKMTMATSTMVLMMMMMMMGLFLEKVSGNVDGDPDIVNISIPQYEGILYLRNKHSKTGIHCVQWNLSRWYPWLPRILHQTSWSI